MKKKVLYFLSGILVGVLISFLVSVLLHLHGKHTVLPPAPHQLSAESSPHQSHSTSECCECSPLRYERKRTPIRGPLPLDWLVQWSGLPVVMRYEFSLNGTIGVDSQPPTTIGAPPPEQADLQNARPQRGSTSHASGGQVYQRLLDKDKVDLLQWKLGSHMLWPKELLDFLIDEVAAGRDISCPDYPQSAPDVAEALRHIGVAGKRVMVGGSVTPWVEAVALHLGAAEVTTTDYSVPICRQCHPRLRTMEMTDVMRRATPADFDVIVSYSSIEHDGLGRYGDPLDPYGDMHAMKEFRTLLRPGGILLLAVPCWHTDTIVQLLARCYGRIRLPLLVEGWDYHGVVNHGVWSPDLPLSRINHWGWQPIIILRATTPGQTHCALNCTDSPSFNDTCRPANNCPQNLRL